MFDLSHRAKIGVAETLQDGLRVITAPNASPMTFTGTNTYILGETHVAIIDPGPDDPAHLEALLKALRGQTVSHILVTHSHIDHSPLAAKLAKLVDAPVLGFGASNAGRSPLMEILAKSGNLGGGEGIDANFKPDIFLQDNEIINGSGWQLQAIHTPGHLSNHLCFKWRDTVFSGDHVMGWSTTMVSPPDGDLGQFMHSLATLQKHKSTRYYCGHGGVLHNPLKMLAYQLTHRKNRETQVLSALKDGHTDINAITAVIYAEIDKGLWPAASRNVLAHLIDLAQTRKIRVLGALGLRARFELV